MRRDEVVAFVVLVIMAVGLGVSQADTITGELKTWHPVTVTFDGPSTSEGATPNPFRDYRLQVTFTGPSSATYEVPGYYAADGNAGETSATSGSKWQVHFVPDEVGTWNYAASFRTGTDIAVDLNASAGSSAGYCDGNTGQFTVAATDKTGADFRGKGMLCYVGQRYLQFAETGEYYLKGGADSPENFLGYGDFDGTPGTHSYTPHAGDWNTGDPTWQSTKGKNMIGALNYLASKGMNSVYFLTMNVNGDGKDVWPWTTSSERYRFDCSKLAQWEIVFSHMDMLGLQLHVVTQEQENDQLLDGGALGTSRKLYYRELVARFAHHLAVTWNLGEENTNTDAQRKAFSTHFKAVDPYDHPVVCHTYPYQISTVYTPLCGYTDFNGPSLQTDNCHSETTTWIDQSAANGHQWIVCLDEVNTNTGKTGVVPDSNDYSHDSIRRDFLYANLMAGGAGCEWYFGYDYPNNDLNCEDWRSREHMWELTKIAMDFFHTHLPFTTMSHNDSLTSASNDYVLADPGEVYAIYLPYGGTTNVTLVAGDYDVKWFDPRNGGALQDGTVTSISSSGGSEAIGQAPNSTSSDWICVLTASAVTATPVVSNTYNNLESTALTNVPVTFSRPCGEGDFDAGITPRINGVALPAQVDVLRTNDDGSPRHALVSFVLPSLAADGSVTIDWLNRIPATPAAYNWAGLDTMNFQLKIEFAVGSDTLVSDVGSIISGNWQAGANVTVLHDGPVMKEFEIVDIPTLNSVPDPYLRVFWRLRTFSGTSNVRVAAVVERCNERVAFVSQPNDYFVDGVTMTYDGSTVLYSEGAYNHIDMSRYRIVEWTQGQIENIERRPNFNYWVECNFIPPYRWEPGITKTAGDVDAQYAVAGLMRELPVRDQGILETGIIYDAMPGTGGRYEMQPYQAWLVAYLLSGGSGTYERILHADGNGGGVFYNVHCREGLAPGHDITTLVYGERPPESWHKVIGDYSFSPDPAHAPSFGYGSYLMTGDKYYAEEMSFWASYHCGQYPYTGLELGDQERAQAFGLRQTVDAALMLPDGHPLLSYFQGRITAYLDEIETEKINDPNGGLHQIREFYQSSGRKNFVNCMRFSSWQSGWLVWALNHAVDKGFIDADAARDWTSEYHIGLYTTTDTFVAPDGNTYTFDVDDAMQYNHATSVWTYEIVPDGYGGLKTNILTKIKNIDNYAEMWYWTKVNEDNTYTPTCQGTLPTLDPNDPVFPLLANGWGHGYYWDPCTQTQKLWYDWHRYGAWDALAGAHDSGLPNAVAAWNAMTALAGPSDYGMEMLPKSLWGSGDVTAPAAATDLSAGSATSSSLTLSWTATGDDGGTGTATSYDLRYSTATITEVNWASATQVSGEPTPSVAGSAESMIITGLNASTTYYFAIKASDEIPNESGLSNVVSGTTLAAGEFVTAPYVQAVTHTSAYVLVEVNSTAVATVEYGLTTAYGSSVATEYSVLTEAPNYIHNIKLAGLSANTQYHYRVTHDGVIGIDQTFWTAANPGTSFRFSFSTDHQDTTYDWPEVATRIKNAGPRFSIYGGDAVQYGGEYWHWEDAFFIDEHMDLLTEVPFYHTVGNHDGWASWLLTEEFVEMPVSASGAQDYYSFDYGDMHVLVLNTEEDVSLGSAQWTFAQSDLSASSATWKVVVCHQGAYVGGGHGEIADMISMATNVFVPNGVHMMFSGHNHFWQHNLVDGIHYVVVCSANRGGYVIEPQPYTLYSQQTTGYAVMDVTPTSFTVTGHRADGTVIETIVLESNDDTAPAAVTDLATSSPQSTTMGLAWTAPGDDGSTGIASSYDIRYATATITEANWASATQVAGEPAPSVAGSAESMTVAGLSPSTTYYFAMKTSDNVPNESAISNVVMGATAAPDTTAPAAVTDMAVGGPTQSTLDLVWTAPGDDGSTGTASNYDIRYSTSTIDTGNWAAATQVTGEPAPSVAGISESMTVAGLTAETTYYFAIKTSDEVPNESALSNVAGGTTSAAPTGIVVDFETAGDEADFVDLVGNPTITRVAGNGGYVLDLNKNNATGAAKYSPSGVDYLMDEGTLSADVHLQYMNTIGSLHALLLKDWTDSQSQYGGYVVTVWPEGGDVKVRIGASETAGAAYLNYHFYDSVHSAPLATTVIGTYTEVQDDTTYSLGWWNVEAEMTTVNGTDVQIDVTITEPDLTEHILTWTDSGTAAVTGPGVVGVSVYGKWSVHGQFDNFTVGGGSTPNVAPTVDAGAGDSITLPTDTVSLDGTVTDDGLPDPPASVATTWTKVSGPGTVTFGDAAAVDTTAQFSTDGVYVLQLEADDSELTTTDTVTVTVDPVANVAPTVDAGLDDAITLPTDTVNLDGTVSDDGLPNPPASVTTTWTKVSGPGTVTFGDAAAVDTTAQFSTDGVYVLQLEANDNELTATDTVTITVNDSAPPAGIVVDFETAGDETDFVDLVGSPTITRVAGNGGYVLDLYKNNSTAAAKYSPSGVDYTQAEGTLSADVHLQYKNDIGTLHGLLLKDFTDSQSQYGGYVITVWPEDGDINVRIGASASASAAYLNYHFLNTYHTAALSTTVVATYTEVQDDTTYSLGWWNVEAEMTVVNGTDVQIDVTITEPDLTQHTLTWTDSGSAAVTGPGVVGVSVYGKWGIHGQFDNLTIVPAGGVPSNVAPTVHAGVDASITLPTDTINLDGTVTDDALPDPPASVTTTWTMVSGSGTVTFGDAAAIDTTAQFSADGVYVLQLEANDSALAATDTVAITVDPEPLPTVVFDVTSSSGTEAVATVNLSVSLSDAYDSGTVTVTYAVTGGTAVDPDDYSIAGTQLTFNSGVTQQDIVIAVVDDGLVESDETIEVTLSNPSKATLGVTTVHTYTITNDDSLPTVAFDLASSNGDEAVTTVNLTVSLSSTYAAAVMVDYTVTGGTATNPDDFTISGTQLTINPGVTSQDIVITVADDAIVEADDTIVVTLSNPSNATLGATLAHTYTIDNDDAYPTVDFDLSASSDGESAGTVNLSVTLSTSYDEAVTVDFAVTGGDASNPADFTIAASPLTFGVGVTQQDIVITVVDDLDVESDETIEVTLSNPSKATLGATTVHTLTILDDDVAAQVDVEFNVVSSSGDESVTPANIEVVLSDVASDVVTVEYSVTGGTATDGVDFSLPIVPTSGVVALKRDAGLTAGGSLANQFAALGAGDVVTAAVKDGRLYDSGSSSYMNYGTTTSVPGPSFGGKFALAYDLSAYTGATINKAELRLSCSGGNNTMQLAGIKSHDWSEGNKDGDYPGNAPAVAGVCAHHPNGLYTSASGAGGWGTNGDQPFDFTGGAADLYAYQGFSSAPAGTAFVVADVTSMVQGWVDGTKANYGMLINVGNHATYTSEAGSVDQPVLFIDYTMTGGGSAVVTFPIGTTSQMIPVTITDDADVEGDETIELTLSNAINATLGINDVHTYTINDNDVVVPSVEFDATASSGVEGVATVYLSVSLDQSTTTTVTVPYSVTGGTAVDPDDYSIAAGPLTFNPGVTQQDIVLTVVDDGIVEADDLIAVTLSAPTNATLGAATTHTYTITNDDSYPTVAFDLASSSGSEVVATVDLTVSLDASYDEAVTIDYAVTGGTAVNPDDFTIAGSQLTFSPGVTSQDIAITVADDGIVEADETIVVTLSNPSNATLGAGATHTYTITNDDSYPTVAFDLSTSSDSESVTTVNLSVSLSASYAEAVTVDYAVTGGDASNPADFTIAASPLTFGAGVTQQDVVIAVVDDLEVESDETIEVTLSNPSKATLGANTVHTYTVVDDDAPTATVVDFETAGDEADFVNLVGSPTITRVAGNGGYVLDLYKNNSTAAAKYSPSGVDYTQAEGTLSADVHLQYKNDIGTLHGLLLKDFTDSQSQYGGYVVTVWPEDGDINVRIGASASASAAYLNYHFLNTYHTAALSTTVVATYTEVQDDTTYSLGWWNVEAEMTVVNGTDVQIDVTITEPDLTQHTLTWTDSGSAAVTGPGVVGVSVWGKWSIHGQFDNFTIGG